MRQQDLKRFILLRDKIEMNMHEIRSLENQIDKDWEDIKIVGRVIAETGGDGIEDAIVFNITEDDGTPMTWVVTGSSSDIMKYNGEEKRFRFSVLPAEIVHLDDK